MIEQLEERWLLITTLYIDYGDRFAGNVLNTTVGALDSTVSGANPNIDGPILSQSTGANYAAATPVAITSAAGIYTAAAVTSLKARMTALTQRFYQGLDIRVVELTSSFQTVDGNSVRAAASLTEISETLGLNEASSENNDAYVIVGRFVIDGTFNPALSSYGGIATGTNIGTLNTADGTAFVCLTGSNDTTGTSPNFLGNQIVHESGHLLGMRHVYRQGTVSSMTNTTATVAQYDRLHQSEVMSYLGYVTQGGFNVFSRYPMMRGDGNTNANTLSASPSPYEAMANDPNIGVGSTTYVTGTGQYDSITVTRVSATTASVTVQPFDDAARTVTIDAPGATGNSYTYTIPTTQPILIDAGGRDDLIKIVGDLNATVTVRGMHGTDSLEIDAQNAATATYKPAATQTAGFDGNSDYRGTLTYSSTTINFQEFESTSMVRMLNAGTLTHTTPGAADSVTFSNTSGDGRVSGSSAAVTIVGLQFSNVATFVLDAAANTGATSIDNITLTPGSVTGLIAATIKTGSGADTISFNGSGVTPNSFTIDTAGGSDALTLSNVQADRSPIYLPGIGANSATLQSGTWAVSNDLGASSQIVNVTVNGGTLSLTGSATHRLNSLTIANGATTSLVASGSRVLVTNALSIGASGKLDLANNDLIARDAALTTIKNLITTGYADGNWNGNGITSSAAAGDSSSKTALGFGSNADLEYGTFSGISGLTGNEILVKYTYYGDADLGGTVDLDDFNLFLAGYQDPANVPQTWVYGDFDYSGSVDLDDFNLFLAVYQAPGVPL
jgi:hypothetical protein